MEVEVNKSRKPFSDRVKGNNNGVARVIGFVDEDVGIGPEGVES